MVKRWRGDKGPGSQKTIKRRKEDASTQREISAGNKAKKALGPSEPMYRQPSGEKHYLWRAKKRPQEMKGPKGIKKTRRVHSFMFPETATKKSGIRFSLFARGKRPKLASCAPQGAIQYTTRKEARVISGDSKRKKKTSKRKTATQNELFHLVIQVQLHQPTTAWDGGRGEKKKITKEKK